MKGYCKYCKKEMDETCIRCSVCDLAWQDGNREGENSMRLKFREIWRMLKNLGEENG